LEAAVTTNISSITITSSTSQPHYAGFIGRLSASAVDLLTLMTAMTALQAFTSGLVYTLANVVVCFAYYAISLSLKSRTFGQWVFGQITLTANYERLSASAATKRAKWIVVSYLLLGLPMLGILFSPKRQALHDLMADTVVILK
jgi:uncharacterized RDD family membrane protein YckC